MSDAVSPEEVAKLQQEIGKQISRLAADCKASSAEHAARFFSNHRSTILQIALKARTEPKKRDLPSPFIYSMQ